MDEKDDIASVTEEETTESLIEGLRQSWHEAMTGQTIPLSQLWDELKDDDSTSS